MSQQPRCPVGGGVTPKMTPHPVVGDAAAVTHIYLLLDRSGSMEAIRQDVVGGFNAFVETQFRADPRSKLTFAQFDTVDPLEIVHDAIPVGDVVPLTDRTFAPRGGTPLLDATGLLVARAAARAAQHRETANAGEDLLFVTITDGQENSSTEYTRGQIIGTVRARRLEGWTFVFLSAGLEVYAEARSMGYHADAVQAWAPDGCGADLAFSSLAEATVRHSHRSRHAAPRTRQGFFQTKPAEDDRNRRPNRGTR